MDSLDYSNLLSAVGEGLMRIAENVELAADGDLDGAAREAALEAGRKKLAEYEAALASVTSQSPVLAKQFVKRFAMHVDLMRESFEQLDGA